jgi:hypothetical protein
MAAPEIYAFYVPVPRGSDQDHSVYRVGDPVMVHDFAMDLEDAFDQLKAAMVEPADGHGRPLITLLSRGFCTSASERGHLPARLHAQRIWDATFATDPAQADPNRRRGPAAEAASVGCTGQNPYMQLGISGYSAFEVLLRQIRARLFADLVAPYLHHGCDTPRPEVIYAFECRRGRHRSVAVCELVAHVLQTSGISSVEIIHEDIPLHRPHRGGRCTGSCGCPGNCGRWQRTEAEARHESAALREARQRACNIWRDYRFQR